MHLKLNSESVQQLEALMKRTGYASHVHCVQVMISQVTKKLLLADAKKQAESSLNNV